MITRRNEAWSWIFSGALLLSLGCGPLPVETRQPGEEERRKIERQLIVQSHVAQPIGPVSVLSATIYVSQIGGPPEVSLVANPMATLPRVGRVVRPRDALTTPGTYLGVTDASGAFLYLSRVGEGNWHVHERSDTEILEGFGTREIEGRVIATRAPFAVGGFLSVFSTDKESGSDGAVKKVLVHVSFMPDKLPDRGVRFRVTQ